ncbi:MAG TPA: teicoplanin resistance protein VanZ [Cyanobacteria bacterium UBA8530]|nr:teicoplanin resistance protein VanZ [Cyanobacteria bacterium UBA8530]
MGERRGQFVLEVLVRFPKKGRIVVLMAWLVLIFLLSADSSSGDHSSNLLQTLLGVFGILPRWEFYDSLHFLIRKLAHFSEYFLLFFLWRWNLKSSFLSLFLAIAYACTDEIHQAFIPHRAGAPEDVLIDAAGALTAWLFFIALTRLVPLLHRQEGSIE